MHHLPHVLLRPSSQARPQFGVSSKQSLAPAMVLEPCTSPRKPAPIDPDVSVLLVSGDSHWYSQLRPAFLQAGLRLVTCSSPERAEHIFLNRCEMDAWLVDVQSLGIEAVYLATQVRDAKPLEPLFVITGARPDEKTLDGFLGNVWMRLRKPIETADLLATVQKVVGRSGRRILENGVYPGERPSFPAGQPDLPEGPFQGEWPFKRADLNGFEGRQN